MNAALLKVSFRSRVMLWTAVALPAAVGRLSAELSHGIVETTVGWVLIAGLVLPTMVALLATHTFRGEHSSWAWMLARPLSRRRVFGTLLCLDVLTIVACYAAARLLLGAAPPVQVFLDVPIPTPALLAVGLGCLYASTGVAAARGSTFLRAAAVGLSWSVALFAIPYGVAHGLILGMDAVVDSGWGFRTLGAWFFASADAGGGVVVLWSIGLVTAAVGVTAGTVVPLLRTTRRLPLALRRRDVVLPGAAPLLTGVVVMLGLVLALRATAPQEVRPGDNHVQFAIESDHDVGEDVEYQLRPASLPQRWNVTSGRRAERRRGHGPASSRWSGLHRGRYEFCIVFVVPRLGARGFHEAWKVFEDCHEVEINDEEGLQTVPVRFDPTRARPYRWE